MVYKATEDVVQRVMPLLERFAERTIDKARLLQYLSARAGIEWGALELVEERQGINRVGESVLIVQVRDPIGGTEMALEYPACLPLELDALVQSEYRRLATDQPLSTMAASLFEALFAKDCCSQCRWQGGEHAQVQRECHFAGRPVNFEPGTSA